MGVPTATDVDEPYDARGAKGRHRCYLQFRSGEQTIMKRVITLLVAGAAFVALSSVLIATSDAAPKGSSHKWKFSPTINSPWALEDDEQPLDSPILAAGLCRSSPWNTVVAYGPLAPNEIGRASCRGRVEISVG